MQRFHLHLRNGVGYVPDDEGGCFSDLDAARCAAIEGARSILSEEVLTGSIDLSGAIEICDMHGALVGTVRFSDAVSVRGLG